jgi:hypothetical protein
VRNQDLQYDSDQFVGDYGYCNKNMRTSYYCYVIHNDIVQTIPLRPKFPAAASLPPKTPDPEEQQFVNRSGYKSADVKGRIVKSFDNGLHFDNGKEFYPSREDGHGGREFDPNLQADSDQFVGDFGYCNGTHETGYECYVIHNDVAQLIPQSPRTRPLRKDDDEPSKEQHTETSPNTPFPAVAKRPSKPEPNYPSAIKGEDVGGPLDRYHSSKSAANPESKTPSTRPQPFANDMVMVSVKFNRWADQAVLVQAMVDTGCSWGMALPKHLADILLANGMAIRAGTTPSVLADGTKVDTVRAHSPRLSLDLLSSAVGRRRRALACAGERRA